MGEVGGRVPHHAVGLVVGTEDSTPLLYSVAIEDGSFVQLDDVVVTERQLPGGQTVRLSGVVTEARARQEGARFDSHVFLISDGVLPARTIEVAEVLTTRVEPDVFVPALPGAGVAPTLRLRSGLAIRPPAPGHLRS